jgi:hypothetical protein
MLGSALLARMGRSVLLHGFSFLVRSHQRLQAQKSRVPSVTHTVVTSGNPANFDFPFMPGC